MNTMYQEIRVWRRLSERSCMRYACFKDLNTGKYGVQSADFYYLPVDEQLRRQHDVQFLELFMGEDPQERCDWFDSLEAAIAAHDDKFALQEITTLEARSADPTTVLANMVGQRIARIEQAFYVFANEPNPSDCALQVRLDNGDTVQFWTGGNGETVRITAAPWEDDFAEPLSAENRAFVEQSGKWTLFDTSTTPEMAPLIGQRIDRVFSVRDERGTMHGVRLVVGSLVLTYAVTGDEGFVIHGPAPDELARYGFVLDELAGGSP